MGFAEREAYSMRKKMKPEELAFIKFFRSQGFKFIDGETGEEISEEEEL